MHIMVANSSEVADPNGWWVGLMKLILLFWVVMISGTVYSVRRLNALMLIYQTVFDFSNHAVTIAMGAHLRRPLPAVSG